MITAVLFVPAAPWFIPSVAPSLLSGQRSLRRAVADLVGATDVPRWAALGVGDARSRSRWDRDLPTDLGRDPYRGGASAGLPGSHFVARALLGPVPLDAGALVPSDLPVGGDPQPPHPVAAGLAEAEADDAPVALLVLADGSTGHGEHAPGAPDHRAAAYDAALHAALVDGPAATRRWAGSADGAPQLAADLGATLPTALQAVLPALAGTSDTWDVAAHDLVVPYGVGHHVVRWSRR